jgi:hypothetical protein
MVWTSKRESSSLVCGLLVMFEGGLLNYKLGKRVGELGLEMSKEGDLFWGVGRYMDMG